MNRLFLCLSAAAATLFLPLYALGHDGEGRHVHLDGVVVPLGPLLIFGAIFLAVAGCLAWWLMHPITRASQHAGQAENASRIFETAQKARPPVRQHRRQRTTVPAPAAVPESVSAPPDMADA